MSSRKLLALIIIIVILAAIAATFEWFGGFAPNPAKSTESRAVTASFNDNDFSGALSHIDSQLLQNPNDADLLIQKASTLAQEGSLTFKEQEYGQQAIQLAQQALAINPQSDEAWRIIGYANEIMQNYPAAHEAYQKSLAINPNNAATISQEAHAYDLQGDLQKADAGYRKALSIDPGLDQASMGLARIDVSEKDYAGALALYEQTAQATQNHRLKAEALYSAGVILGAQGDHAQAEQLMQTAITIDPAYPLGFVGLGTEQFALAIASSSQLSAQDRSYLVAASFDSLRQAIALNPDQASASLQLGLELAAVGQKDTALKAFEAAKSAAVNDITLNAIDKERLQAQADAAIKTAASSNK
jgi:tetratricopeptide (TPR) repeat protein